MERTYTVKTAITAVIASVIIGLTGIQQGCELKKAGRTENITIAVVALPLSAPVYIAHEKGFFEREGLRITLQPYTTGKDALAAVIGGKAHFGTVAETALMFAGMKGERIYIISTIADSRRLMGIVARKDRGIAGPEDLKGKTIGVTMGTYAEYFLHAYLTFNSVAENRVHKVDMNAEQIADALAKGDIDAAVAWHPHITHQQKILGTNAVILANETIYKMWWNIAAAQDYVKENPETVKKLLRALIQAQHYIVENPQEVQKVMAGYVRDDTAVLGDINFDVRLSQNLILSLENQARWALRSGLTDKKKIPNFLRLIYTDGLEAVDPDSVTVVQK